VGEVSSDDDGDSSREDPFNEIDGASRESTQREEEEGRE
jgi:hypothetical protein